MKKAIELKLLDINAEMSKLENEHLYWTTIKWKILQGQRDVLAEILQSA